MRIIHLSRRRLLPALLLVLSALGIFLFLTLRSHSAGPDTIAVGSAGCVAYLEKLGWQVNEDPIETLQLQLPEDLSDEYSDYLALQKEQKLPLAQYGGQTVCRYTFQLTNYPGGRTDAQANILLCGSTVIAGDVILLGPEGGRFPLAYPNQP